MLLHCVSIIDDSYRRQDIMLRTPAKHDKVAERTSMSNETMTSGVDSPQNMPSKTLEKRMTPTDKHRSAEKIKEVPKALSLTFSPPRKVQSEEPSSQKEDTAAILYNVVRSSQTSKEIKKRKDRLVEAKACMQKVNTQLGSSRNIKSEIKTEVKKAVERLYELVKEAEMERKGAGIGGNTSYEVSTVEIGIMTEIEKRDILLAGINKTLDKNISNDEILKKLQENTKLLEQGNSKIEELTRTVECYQTEIKETRSSYASVVATNLVPKGLRVGMTLHSLAITPNNQEDSGDDVLDRVREVLNVTDGEVEIERVRKAKDRKVIIGCKTQADREKVKEKLSKVKSHLTIEDIKNKDPLVMIIGVLKSHKDEDIYKALRNQNKKVFQGLSEEDSKMEVAYKIRNRNPHTQRVIMRVATKLWQRLTNAGSVRIDMQPLRVVDRSPLVQCSMCLAYGHGKRLCTETQPRCSHCGGLHLKTDCRELVMGSAPSCINCTRNKRPDVEHNAFSETCSVRAKWDEIARSAVAYC